MDNTALKAKIIPVIGSARSRVDHEGDWVEATRIAQSCQTGACQTLPVSVMDLGAVVEVERAA